MCFFYSSKSSSILDISSILFSSICFSTFLSRILLITINKTNAKIIAPTPVRRITKSELLTKLLVIVLVVDGFLVVVVNNGFGL